MVSITGINILEHIGELSEQRREVLAENIDAMANSLHLRLLMKGVHGFERAEIKLQILKLIQESVLQLRVQGDYIFLEISEAAAEKLEG